MNHEYSMLLIIQKNKCAICDRSERSMNRSLAINYNNVDGSIRALLCRDCNSGVNSFNQEFDKLLNAAKYIQEKDGII